MTLEPGKKIFFVSDLHLGVPDRERSLAREKRLIRWLEEVRHEAQEIYIVGDLFDFWFEYKKAVPRGYVRLLGKLAELSDAGLPIHLFTGNHDMWIFDYMPEEIGLQLYREPIVREYAGKRFFIGHGDGLGPGDHGYKFIKKVFANKLCQWLFARLHPNFGIGLADFWSRRSRAKTGTSEEEYMGDDKEFLVQFCRDTLTREHYDYFVFGHRHLDIDMEVGEGSRYVNLGDWLKESKSTYGVFDGERMTLKKFEG